MGDNGNKKVLWAGLAVALVLIASAVSFRIIKTTGNIEVSGSQEGVSVKISEAKQDLEQVRQILDDLKAQLEMKDEALRKAENALKSKEERIQQLLARLEEASHSAAPSPAVANLRAELSAVLRQPAVTRKIVAPVDSAKFKTAGDKLTNVDRVIRSMPAGRK
jgi:septal ring factor EnvC (AmiA/AmiB activator)